MEVIALWDISEKEFDSRLKDIQEKNKSKERKKILEAEKAKYKIKRKFPSTSKVVLFAVFLLCVEIILFSEYAMITLADTSAMYVLIGVPTTLVPTIISYYHKSRIENTKGGIVYDIAMSEKEQQDIGCDEPDEFEENEFSESEEANPDGTQG